MAEIDNHVCGGGALVDLDDLAFELVTRTELHYFSPSQSPPFFSTAIGASFNKMRRHRAARRSSSSRRGLSAGNLWRGTPECSLADLNASLTAGVPLVRRRHGHWHQPNAAKSHIAGGPIPLVSLAFCRLYDSPCVSRNTRGRQWRTLAYPSVWTSPTATASAPARLRSWRRYASRDRSPPRRGILVCRIGVPGFSSSRSTKACPSLPSPPRPEGPAAEALPLPRSASR